MKMLTAQFWVGLILGGIIGAVLSVLFDRLWRRIEQAVRLRVHGSYFINVHDETGISFALTNDGEHPIPPHRLCIWAPTFGSYFIFAYSDTEAKPLGPKQTDKYEFPVIKSGKATERVTKWATSHDGKQWYHCEHPELAFRVTLDKGDTVLYENRRLGLAFCRMVSKAVETGELDPNGMEMAGLFAPSPTFMERVKAALIPKTR